MHGDPHAEQGQQPPYGYPPAYGPPPGYGYGYPPPGYGYPPPWNGPQFSRSWPYGPDRPGVATAAAVLGFVTAGLTLLMSVFFVAVLTRDDPDPVTGVLLLGLPCAIGMIIGGVRLLGRRPPVVLAASAFAAVLVLVIALVAGLLTLSDAESLFGLAVILGLAAPLPIVTAVLAWRPVVAGWVAAAR